MKIQWMETDENNILLISEATRAKYRLFHKRIIVHLGAWKREVDIMECEELEENTIGLPMSLEIPFLMPEDIEYDMVVDDREVFVGPIIVYIPFKKSKQLTESKLDSYKKRFKNQELFNGCIIICTEEDIDTESDCVEGYYYHKETHEWKRGHFPLPHVIFTRLQLRQTTYNHLVLRIGDKIFNSKIFNKWELWKWLHDNETVKDFLPTTRECLSLEQIDNMLEQFQIVYLKPTFGSSGRGIYRVAKIHSGYVIEGKNYRELVHQLENSRKLTEFVEKKNYLIQQGIIVNNSARHSDFRCYLQMNGLKQWVCQGIIGRIGKEGKVTTNLKHVDEILTGKEALMKVFDIDSQRAEEVEKKLIRTSITVCHELNKTCGHFGDVAIDIIVDSDLNVWILEINKRYGSQSILKMQKKELYHLLKITPFYYAKALAGF
ncbi:YheC/YheD family protein [Bacillus timonensis]|nr:YheC/YheD family protein [Bacillus timonensis]